MLHIDRDNILQQQILNDGCRVSVTYDSSIGLKFNVLDANNKVLPRFTEQQRFQDSFNYLGISFKLDPQVAVDGDKFVFDIAVPTDHVSLHAFQQLLTTKKVITTTDFSTEKQTLTGYIDSQFAALGSEAKSLSVELASQKDFNSYLNTSFLNTAGVDLDAEALNFSDYEKQYKAAAKVINTYDKTSDMILKIFS